MNENPFALGDKIQEHVANSCATCASYAWRFADGSEGYGAWGTYELDGQTFGASSLATYDLASLTKPFTATAILLLERRRQLFLGDPVQRFLPDFVREDVTIRHLLTHTSMLDLYLSDARAADPTVEGIRRHILGAGKKEGRYFYQDPNMILLGWILEAVTGQPLDGFLQQEIFTPLGMENTRFGIEDGSRKTHTMPTRRHLDGRTNPGEVHDPTAQILGGVAGHAGLFSTTEDMMRFLRMWNGGEDSLLTAEMMRHALKPYYSSPDMHFGQALGWKMDAPKENIFPMLRGAYMHGGFTGTFALFSPELQMEFVLLTNDIFPGERTQEERRRWWHSVRQCVEEVAKEARAARSFT